MTFKQYKNIKEFYNDTYNILMKQEAQNLIPLGNIIIGNEGKDKTGWRDPINWFMATVSDYTGILLTAIMTPPHNLTLYATDNHINDEALKCLIKNLIENNISIPGVMSDNILAESFAKRYTSKKSMKYRINRHQRIYELEKINPDIKSFGKVRLAKESDMSFLPYWSGGFTNECLGTTLSIQQEAECCRYHISSGKLYILEDNGTSVSMAKINREMQTVCGVSYVYTPPYFRKKGYATSVVAAVSKIILEKGFKKCVLYTDLDNPTSNSIYQKIGYKPICDSLEIRFE